MDTQKDLHDYLICALWSSTDDDCNPLDDRYSIEDIEESSFEVAKKEVADFMVLAEKHLSDRDENQVPSHDFWLTRNGHGSGFWDGGYVNGNILTEISQQFGECHLMVGDNGKLYFI